MAEVDKSDSTVVPESVEVGAVDAVGAVPDPGPARRAGRRSRRTAAARSAPESSPAGVEHDAAGGGVTPALTAGTPLAVVIKDWLDTKRAGRGLSDNTERAYRNDLARVASPLAAFHRLPADEPALEKLTVAHLSAAAVRHAMAHLARGDYSPTTRARTLGTLAGLCAWLVTEGLLLVDPTAGLDRPRPERPLPSALDEPSLARLAATVATVDPTARSPWPRRDVAILAVLAGAGLRASELAVLTVTDFADTADPPLILVRSGKGGTHRNIPIPPEVVHTVRYYLTERTDRCGPFTAKDPLFVTGTAAAFTRQSLAWHVQRWFTRAGIAHAPGEQVHRLRHTYAVGLVSNGVPINQVQALLGHTNLSSTQIYLRATATDLAAAIQAAPIRAALIHPRQR